MPEDQKLLGLYFLLDLGDASESKDSVIKDLLFEASPLNLNLNFKLFAPVDMEIIDEMAKRGGGRKNHNH